MGLVTGEASFTLGDGAMDDAHLRTLFRMAFDTEAVPLPGKKFSEFRSMGVVAGEAFTLLERRMVDSPPSPELGNFVTLVTELGAFQGDGEWLRRGG